MMLESEKFAIAAHLHVLLRRINGRVTDVEWMIKSPEYAREVIRVTRQEKHEALLQLADKLEAALQVAARPVVRPAPPVERRAALAQSEAADSSSYPASDYPASGFGPSGFDPSTGRKRYVGSLR
jgi:hypothetical protein